MTAPIDFKCLYIDLNYFFFQIDLKCRLGKYIYSLNDNSKHVTSFSECKWIVILAEICDVELNVSIVSSNKISGVILFKLQLV